MRYLALSRTLGFEMEGVRESVRGLFAGSMIVNENVDVAGVSCVNRVAICHGSAAFYCLENCPRYLILGLGSVVLCDGHDGLGLDCNCGSDRGRDPSVNDVHAHDKTYPPHDVISIEIELLEISSGSVVVRVETLLRS